MEIDSLSVAELVERRCELQRASHLYEAENQRLKHQNLLAEKELAAVKKSSNCSFRKPSNTQCCMRKLDDAKKELCNKLNSIDNINKTKEYTLLKENQAEVQVLQNEISRLKAIFLDRQPAEEDIIALRHDTANLSHEVREVKKIICSIEAEFNEENMIKERLSREIELIKQELSESVESDQFVNEAIESYMNQPCADAREISHHSQILKKISFLERQVKKKKEAVGEKFVLIDKKVLSFETTSLDQKMLTMPQKGRIIEESSNENKAEVLEHLIRCDLAGHNLPEINETQFVRKMFATRMNMESFRKILINCEEYEKVIDLTGQDAIASLWACSGPGAVLATLPVWNLL